MKSINIIPDADGVLRYDATHPDEVERACTFTLHDGNERYAEAYHHPSGIRVRQDAGRHESVHHARHRALDEVVRRLKELKVRE